MIKQLLVIFQVLSLLFLASAAAVAQSGQTSPSRKALSGMLAVFAEFERSILKERVKAGIAESRSKGRAYGRPKSAANKKEEVRKLHQKGINYSEISRKLKIGKTSVIRIIKNS